MSPKDKSNPHQYYEIQVSGKLDESWSDWFNGLTVIVESHAEDAPITMLRGMVADQVALRGILSKLWDLNLELRSVTRVEPDFDEPTK